MTSISKIIKEFENGCNPYNISDPPNDLSWIKSFITKSITTALEECMPKKNKNLDWGYNNAIADYQEKVKKFLEL